MIKEFLSFALGLLLLSTPAFAITLNPTYVGPGLNGDKERAARYMEAVKEVERVVNQEPFKSAVLLKTFTSTRRSSADVLLDIGRASELLSPGDNQVWEWEFGFYYKRSKVIGWTNGSIKTVWINRYQFDDMDLESIAANIAHEYMHKIGYDHASAKDHRSVPYAVGYLVEELINKGKAGEPPVLTQPQAPQIKPRRSWWKRLKSALSPWS